MTADEVIAMAQRAGYPHVGLNWNDQEQAFLMRFAALVASAEREACAALIESTTERSRWIRGGINGTPIEPCQYAAAIRARGKP